MDSLSTDLAKSRSPDTQLRPTSSTNVDSGLDKYSDEINEGDSMTSLSLEVNDGADASHWDKEEVNDSEDRQEPVDSIKRLERSSEDVITDDAPPLPDESVPPLPQEPPPTEDDGWAPVWEETAQAFYFYNRFTGATQWTNPRVPAASQFVENPPGEASIASTSTALPEDANAVSRPAGGYDPSIHGDYDPTAWYAQPAASDYADTTLPSSNPADAYAATGAFNRFTGRWQAADLTPENHNDENKSKRQMNAFFDVDAAANSHDGRSLKAERSGKKLSKTELKQFKEKRKAKKEEKRRAWLRD